MSFVLGTTARASDNQNTTTAPKKIKIYSKVTGSRIPQLVVEKGRQVNSGSPLYIVSGNDLTRTGATSIAGMLALDPSITIRRGIH